MAVPATPSNLKVMNTGGGAIRVYWPLAADATSYKIYRDPTAGATTLLAGGVTAVPYFDESGADATDYYFRIKATNGDGDSGYSNEVHVLRKDTSTRKGAQVNVVKSVPVPVA